MSGYFRRLLTQSATTAARLRPVTPHPYATLASGGDQSSEDVVAGRGARSFDVTLLAPGLPDGSSRSGTSDHRDDLAGGEPHRSRSAHDAASADVRQRGPAETVSRTLPRGSGRIRNRDARGAGVDAHQRPVDGAPGDSSASDGLPVDESLVADASGPGHRGPDLDRADANRRSSNTVPRTGATAHADESRSDFSFRLLPDAPPGDRWPESGAALTPATATQLPDAGRATRRGAGEATREIHVTIGRIEVTAQHAAPPAKTRREQPAAMSLDDYLSRRRQGGA